MNRGNGSETWSHGHQFNHCSGLQSISESSSRQPSEHTRSFGIKKPASSTESSSPPRMWQSWHFRYRWFQCSIHLVVLALKKDKTHLLLIPSILISLPPCTFSMDVLSLPPVASGNLGTHSSFSEHDSFWIQVRGLACVWCAEFKLAICTNLSRSELRDKRQTYTQDYTGFSHGSWYNHTLLTLIVLSHFFFCTERLDILPPANLGNPVPIPENSSPSKHYLLIKDTSEAWDAKWSLQLMEWQPGTCSNWCHSKLQQGHTSFCIHPHRYALAESPITNHLDPKSVSSPGSISPCKSSLPDI